jgi:hypothetical protein
MKTIYIYLQPHYDSPETILVKTVDDDMTDEEAQIWADGLNSIATLLADGTSGDATVVSKESAMSLADEKGVELHYLDLKLN